MLKALSEIASDALKNTVYSTLMRFLINAQPLQSQQQPSVSIADEIMKLANLKEEGIIPDEEFQQMKQDLIKKKSMITRASMLLIIIGFIFFFTITKTMVQTPSEGAKVLIDYVDYSSIAFCPF